MEKERLTEELGSTSTEDLASPDSLVDSIEEEPQLNGSASNDVPSEQDEMTEEATANVPLTDETDSKDDTEVSDGNQEVPEIKPEATASLEEPEPQNEPTEQPASELEIIEPAVSDEESNEPVSEKEEEPVVEEQLVVATPTTEEIKADSKVEEEIKVDYSKSSKGELLEVLVELVRKDDVATLGNALKEIKEFFDVIDKKEKEIAKQSFIGEGGDPDEFKFQTDEISQKFFANYQILRERRQKYFKQLEKQKEENHKIKEEILEELRLLVDGEESTTSVKVINQIRDKWKNTGPIPRQYNKTLWANYNALMDRFYDNRSIYFELKELDRKKNLELKIALCEKAEALDANDDLKSATFELNNFHEDFKHIGPVPQENQEELWLRFKAASDNVYSKRKEYIEEMKDQLQGNLEQKMALCEEIETFVSFSSDRITDWNSKTKEIQALQEKWEKVGGLPRDKSKTINRRFWSSLKGFFANKSKFFKSLDGQKEDNLKLKEELVKRAEELKDNEDVLKTTDLFKKLQQEWKEVGPVPDKVRNEIYKQFKAACDAFFDRKRASQKESEKEFVENLKRKEEVCNQLEDISKSDKIDLDIVEALQAQFAGIGFVPRSDLKRINKRYDDVLNLLKQKLEDSELTNKEQLALEIDIRKMKGRPGADKQIERQGHHLRRQINTIENDISTWKNNLEFFTASKTADKLKKEFDVKIDAANEELKELKKQLRLVQSV